jgi:hypothetical protein
VLTRNPYRIDGPALISFSGGRTSGYMLRNILDAHGGTLPDDVHVVFANTGKEMPETLDFVQECGERWGVRITWLEWRDNEAGYDTVSHNSASRNGEPFKALIDKRGFLPNPVMRFCTQEMKVRPMQTLMLSLPPSGAAQILTFASRTTMEPPRWGIATSAFSRARPRSWGSSASGPIWRGGGQRQRQRQGRANPMAPSSARTARAIPRCSP